MARKRTNAMLGDIPFTEQEEIDRDAEDLAFANKLPPPPEPPTTRELEDRIKILENKPR